MLGIRYNDFLHTRNRTGKSRTLWLSRDRFGIEVRGDDTVVQDWQVEGFSTFANAV